MHDELVCTHVLACQESNRTPHFQTHTPVPCIARQAGHLSRLFCGYRCQLGRSIDVEKDCLAFRSRGGINICSAFQQM